MDESVLKANETFMEFPNKYLAINKNSNLFYIKVNDKKYLCRENVDKATTVEHDEKKFMKCTRSYRSIIDGTVILYSCAISPIEGGWEEIMYGRRHVKVLSINQLFNLDEEIKYLSYEDLKKMLGIVCVVKKKEFK